MSRRPVILLSVAAVMVAGATTGAFVLAQDREPTPVPVDEDTSDGLMLVVVRTRGGPLAAVVGSTGGRDGALVLPSETRVTIPGQGEATLGEALALPARQAATTVANLLGVWVDHHATLGPARLSEVVERAGGIAVGDDVLGGDEVVALLDEAADGASSALTLVIGGLLAADAPWEPPDLANADSPSTALAILEASAGARAAALPVTEAATDVFVAEPEMIRDALVGVFGGPDRDAVGVIVLNGSGVPGIGELVAEQIVPGGFRVVVSENASSFDHEETLVVVGSADDVALGERVRDLLGTGSVNVSVSSGIAPVTVVVGRDFTG